MNISNCIVSKVRCTVIGTTKKERKELNKKECNKFLVIILKRNSISAIGGPTRRWEREKPERNNNQDSPQTGKWTRYSNPTPQSPKQIKLVKKKKDDHERILKASIKTRVTFKRTLIKTLCRHPSGNR